MSRTSRLASRDRLRWMAAGVVGAAAVAAVDLTLRLLVGWPATGVPVAIAVAVVLAAALAASWTPRLARDGGRVLVTSLSAAAFTVVVCAVYLVIVGGLGNSPTGHGDRETLALSMVAAVVVAVSFGPARRRLVDKASRVVYGNRHVPDELVRSFASRMNRS
ncbi:MAG TPA: hypothetical protein VFH70_12050, partial [Acidimicrobiales bacterium]|nr:hypothetical protein [Acidimicrobiales bacterium]